MRKPEDYKMYPRHLLGQIAHELNVWNANQPISDPLHNKHYKDEIAPIYAEMEKKWDEFWIKQDAKNPAKTKTPPMPKPIGGPSREVVVMLAKQHNVLASELT